MRRLWWLVSVPLVALVLACGVGGGDSNADRPMEGAAGGATGEAIATTAPAAVPLPADFVGVVKVSDKQCFGSAGCQVTFTVAWSYKGSTPLDPAQTWSLTYEVSGVEDGPLVATVDVTGGKYEAEEHFSTTKRKADKLTAKATVVAPAF